MRRSRSKETTDSSSIVQLSFEFVFLRNDGQVVATNALELVGHVIRDVRIGLGACLQSFVVSIVFRIHRVLDRCCVVEDIATPTD